MAVVARQELDPKIREASGRAASVRVRLEEGGVPAGVANEVAADHFRHLTDQDCVPGEEEDDD